MARSGSDVKWMMRIVQEPQFRDREYRIASLIEASFSLLGFIFVCAAVWCLTNYSAVIDRAPASAAGGMALLCFIGCMMIAASGGIKKRFICLVIALESRSK